MTAPNPNQQFLDLSKSLIPIFNELKSSARLLGEASEKLTNAGLDKYTEQLKKALKTQELITEKDLEEIKDAKILQKVMSKLEDQFESILKIEEEVEKVKVKRLSKIVGQGKIADANRAKVEAGVKDYLKGKLAENNLTLEMVETIKRGIPVIRAETEARGKQLLASDGLNKAHEKLTKSIETQVLGFFSLAAGTAMLKKSFFNAYEQMNRMTSVGLLGAIGTLNTWSFKLKITTKEFEEMVARNRDLVNQYGGGEKGIAAFGKQVKDVSDQMNWLGKAASPAAERLIMLSKQGGGLIPSKKNIKDQNIYNKNIVESKDHFERLNRTFGDTSESYAELMNGMYEEVNTRNRLNSLNKEQVALELSEIRVRTENLKNMGFTNKQIVEFNKSIIDPRNDSLSDRATQGVMFKSLRGAMVDALGREGTTEEHKKVREQLMDPKTVNAVNELVRLQTRGTPEQMKKFLDSKEGTDAAAIMQKADALIKEFDPYKTQVVQQLAKGGGKLTTEVMDARGGARNTAIANKAARDQLTDRERAEDDEENRKAQAKDSNLAKSLDAMTAMIERFNNVLENPLIQALTGIAQIVGGITLLIAGPAGLKFAIKSLISMIGKGGAAAAAGAAAEAAAGAAGAGAAGAGAAATTGLMAGAAVGAAPLVVMGGVAAAADWAQENPKEALKLMGLDRIPESDMDGAQRIKNQGGSNKDWVKRYKSQMELGTKWSSSEAGAIKEKYGLTVPVKTETPGAIQDPAVAAKWSGAIGYGKDFAAPGATPLGNLIAKGESGAEGYNASNKGTQGKRIIPGDKQDLSKLTIGDVMKRQALSRGDPDRLFAVGKYQMIPDTFKEAVNYLKISPNTQFTPEVQEQMFQYLIMKKRPEIGDYISGKSSDLNGVMLAASKEWASIANPKTGVSYYGGANSASISTGQMSTALQQMRSGGVTPNKPYSMPNSASMMAGDPTAPAVPAVPPVAPAKTAEEQSIMIASLTDSELKKQTSLLAQLVQNTTGTGRQYAYAADNYKKDPATVMSGVAG